MLRKGGDTLRTDEAAKVDRPLAGEEEKSPALNKRGRDFHK
jgi:hypothetical protein